MTGYPLKHLIKFPLFFFYQRYCVSYLSYTKHTRNKAGKGSTQTVIEPWVFFFFSSSFRICTAMFVQKPNSLVNSFQKISSQTLLNSAALKEWRRTCQITGQRTQLRDQNYYAKEGLVTRKITSPQDRTICLKMRLWTSW